MYSSNKNIPTTVIYKPKDYISYTKVINFSVSNITLEQQPSENFDFTLSLWHNDEMYCMVKSQDDKPKIYYCKVILAFRRELYLFEADYDYEITCKAFYANDKAKSLFQLQPLNQHQLLFTLIGKRINNMIIIDNINIGRLIFPIVHFCFTIYRFKLGQSLCSHVNTVAPTDNLSIGLGSQLLKSGDYSDVILRVGEREFKAHRLVLAASSSVFKAMFHNEMLEKATGVVEIVDIEPHVIAEILSYIYTGTTKNISSMATQLFKAAHKYELEGLLRLCGEFFSLNLNYYNVVDILELYRIYRSPYLPYFKSILFLNRYEKEIVKNSNYHEYLKRDLSEFSLVNTLKLCARFDMGDVKSAVLEFIKCHWRQLAKNQEFMGLFNSNPDLMKEIYVYISEHSIDADDYNVKR